MKHVFQLAHVAFKGQLADGFELGGRQTIALGTRFPGDPRQQGFTELRQVFPAMPQGRNRDLDHVEPVEQILPEATCMHFGAQIPVGGTHDACIHGLFQRRSQGAHLALLDGAKQLGLHRQGQVADLVQKQGPAGGRLEEAWPILRSPGVGALERAEEFGFQQILRNRAAVDGHERPVAAMAAGVDGPRHQLLASAGLTVHQHRRHAAGHLGHALLHALHGRRIADKPRQSGTACFAGRTRPIAVGALQRLGFCRRCLCRSGVVGRRGPRRAGLAMQGRGDDVAELFQINRLGEVVEGPGLECLHGVFRRAVGGDHDAALRALVTRQFAKQCQPFAVGQAHVGDQQVVAVARQEFAGLGQRAGRLHLVAFAQQGQLVQRAQIGFVVDNQQPRCIALPWALEGCAHWKSIASSGNIESEARGRWKLRKNSLPSTSTSPWARCVRS